MISHFPALIRRFHKAMVTNALTVTIWATGLTSAKLIPGDSIFVPAVVARRSAYSQFIQGFKDWTTILY